MTHFLAQMIAAGGERFHGVAEGTGFLNASGGLGRPLHYGIRTRRQLEGRAARGIRRLFPFLRKDAVGGIECVCGLEVGSGKDEGFAGPGRRAFPHNLNFVRFGQIAI
jgi:hypothetical protein